MANFPGQTLERGASYLVKKLKLFDHGFTLQLDIFIFHRDASQSLFFV